MFNLNEEGKIITWIQYYETLKFLYSIETYNSMNFKEKEKAIERLNELREAEKPEKPKAQETQVTTSETSESNSDTLTKLLILQAELMLEIAKGKEELKPALERIEEAIKAHS
jgi:hypothetical protein